MQMTPGTAVGHYEVIQPLGKGGMGEVYRAKDTKLGREVAIKILPEEFTRDVDRLARFEREARVLASLDHPHVAAIHGFEDVDGIRFLVMQLAEGEDLSDRLRRGPIPVEEAVEIAKQIAEALEVAHEQGIVHRDLKPANIKVDEDGKVRILDFGLAKAFETEESDEDFTNSPTMVRAATHAGVILGTAAYMSPEQARGKKVDKRADIWAFGVVLWEMLTGKRLFGGETVSDTLASVLKEEPDWSELPAETPASVRRVLKLCLRRHPKERMRDIGDARLELDESGRSVMETASLPARSSLVPWLVAAVAVVVLIGVMLVWKTSSANAVREPLYLRVPLEPADRLGEDPSVVISPDGKTIVFRGQIDGRTQLFARTITSPEASMIPGSEGAGRPAFSADGSSIVFAARGRIWRTSLTGVGDPTPLAQERVGNGGCWSPSGSVIISGSWATGLKRIPESGGKAVPLTVADPGTSHIWPYCLPDGEHVLFTRWSGESTEAISIFTVALSTGETREIIADAKAPRYHPSGVLTFLRGNTLMAVRFDAEHLEVQGDPAAVLSRVSYDLGVLGASYDLSASGTLAYVQASEWQDQRGYWVDLGGNPVGEVEPRLPQWTYPRISHDGSKLLVTEEGPAYQVWIIDLKGGPRTQLTSRYDNGEAIWTPDGDVVFFSNRNSRYEILRQAADGSSEPEVLVGGEGAYPVPQDVSPDGRFLLFSSAGEADNRDLWVLDLLDGGEAKRIVASEGVDRTARFSPDGSYIAYQSTRSGREEIYVTPFPGPGASWQISTGRGLSPVWSPDGRSLLFHDGKGHVMQVATTLGSQFRAGKPQELFERDFKYSETGADFDISRDGTRILFMEAADMTPYQQLNIVLNWDEVLAERLPER